MASQVSQDGVKFITSNQKLPDYIRNHEVFKKLNKIQKVFPSIGLPNCSEPCQAANLIDAKEAAIHLVYYNIRNSLQKVIRETGGSSINLLISSFEQELYAAYLKIIQEEGGKIVLRTISEMFLDGKKFISKGESVFKAYNKIGEELKKFNKEIQLTPLEEMPSFKSFSGANLCVDDKYKIVFSSDGETGIWDIATMSMRGISSCQAWGGTQSYGLIGSISSKYVGVIYITDSSNFNEKGTRMLRRAVVRFVVNSKTKKPALFIDKIYPNDDLTVRNILAEFLTKKSNLPVIFRDNPDVGSYYLPDDTAYQGVPFKNNEFSYMDTKIPYKSQKIVVDNSRFYERLKALSTFLSEEVHNTIVKQCDFYLASKEEFKEQFSGGVINLLIALSQVYSNTSFFLTDLYQLSQPTSFIKLPDANKFLSATEWEKAAIKCIILNFAALKIHTQGRFNSSVDSRLMSFYPKSKEKLFNLVWSLYKKKLLEHYKNLE